jgi:uncharacterized membrane protein
MLTTDGVGMCTQLTNNEWGYIVKSVDEKTTTSENTAPLSGLAPNVAGALAYSLAFVSGIYFFVTYKDKFVRFHAFQSIVLFIGLAVVNAVLVSVPFLGLMISPLLGVGSVILWVLLMVKAYQNEKFKLPVIGDMAENQTK